MKIRNIILIVLTLVMSAALAVFAAACEDPTVPGGNSGGNSGGSSATSAYSGDIGGALAAPSGVGVDAMGKVTWSRVADTTGYEVDVNGTIVSVRFTNYDLLSFGTLPADGQFTVKVRSVSGDKKGEWSAGVDYTYSGGAVVTPSVQGVENGTLKWTKPTFATFTGISEPYPVVTVDGTATELDKNAESYALGKSGEVSLYYKADGVYYHDSGEIRLVYDADDKSLSFAAPKNVRMDGDLLRFDEVVGANVYYLEDVYNTVTQITGSDILSLSSDREGHFLIKAMWAGSTDLDIGNSAPSVVTYFTEEQGAGTEANPYLIRDASQLRFIEYYEAMGESRYYKLASDVEFTSYAPANDEDFSNFYNLGSLSGVIDGDGHTLKNIVVYYKDGYSSIFDTITADGVIKNLKIESTVWRTWTNRTNDGIMHEKGGECAILTYTNYGTIQNVALVSGTVTSVRDGAAGLVSINRGTIEGCTMYKDFSVYGEREAGAFAIFNEGTVRRCVNYGSVAGVTTIGGIVGRNAGTVTECGNEGDVTGQTAVGGIVGYNYNVGDAGVMQYATKVSYCYNTGDVTSDYYAGGIVGRNGSDGFDELGESSFANAAVHGCYNQGAVKGGVSVGGIVGVNYDASDGTDDFGVKACYSTGDVGYNVKGLVSGRIYLSVAACDWAEDGGAAIYAHYWQSETVTTPWPGIRMGKEVVDGKTYYYVNMPAYTPVGIIFSRVDPNDPSNVWNRTEDVAAAVGNTWVYYINPDWSSGAAPRSAGLIAGYSTAVYDCYYMSGQTLGASGIKLAPTLSGGGTMHGLTRDEMRAIADELNQKLNNAAFVAVDGKYPVLKWQSDDKEAGNG